MWGHRRQEADLRASDLPEKCPVRCEETVGRRKEETFCPAESGAPRQRRRRSQEEEERHAGGQQAQEKMPASLIIREIQTKITARCHPTLDRTAIIRGCGW